MYCQLYSHCFARVYIVFICRIKRTGSSHVKRSTRIDIRRAAIVPKVFLCVLRTHLTVNRRDIVLFSFSFFFVVLNHAPHTRFNRDLRDQIRI